MRIEKDEGRERPTAPRPSKASELSLAADEHQNPKEAKLLDEQVEYTAPVSGWEDVGDKKIGLSGRKISALTDISALHEYFERIGAEPRSLKTAVVKEQAGKYRRDLATIRVSPAGEIDAPDEYAPTESEAAAIKVGCSGVVWPKAATLAALGEAPDMVRRAAPQNVFEFRDVENRIVMLQVRDEDEHGRRFVPWTYWDDGEWRMAEPDGLLPLFGAEKLKGASTVFIHEGAKAARHVQWMAEGKTREARDALKAHPWGRQLGAAVHVGWIGGAPSPHRTDWSVLKKAGVTTVYIVADNDDPGRDAVPEIARAISCPTYMIQFTGEFPSGFDLADPFPEKQFADGFWTGPSFESAVHPATFATYQVEPTDGKGRPSTHLRASFKGQWKWVSKIERFVFERNPSIRESREALNIRLRPFSQVDDTVRLMRSQDFHGVVESLCYRPNTEERRLTVARESAINVYRRSAIEPIPGDPTPFLEFLAYLFPRERERKLVERWIATLVARPEVRMGYALLLISVAQGTGKTTLGSGILAPLMGEENVVYPNENEITGEFNSWLAMRRLAIVNEIYQGSNWKAYNALKSAITDRIARVNQKFEKQYEIENWCHVFACSNSIRALKMEDEDRRWLCPEVQEVPWPKENFDRLHRWIQGKGLGIVANWARTYGDYVEAGERAPMTDKKKEMIQESRSEAQSEAAAMAANLVEMKVPAALGIKDVHKCIEDRVSGKVFESPLELRKAMLSVGAKLFDGGTVKMGGYNQFAVMNDALAAEIERVEDPKERKALIRDRRKNPNEVLNQYD